MHKNGRNFWRGLGLTYKDWLCPKLKKRPNKWQTKNTFRRFTLYMKEIDWNSMKSNEIESWLCFRYCTIFCIYFASAVWESPKSPNSNYKKKTFRSFVKRALGSTCFLFEMESVSAKIKCVLLNHWSCKFSLQDFFEIKGPQILNLNSSFKELAILSKRLFSVGMPFEYCKY